MVSVTGREVRKKQKKFCAERLEFAIKSDIAKDRVVLSVWDIAFPKYILDCEELPWRTIHEHGMGSLDALLQKFRYDMREII